MMRAQRSVSIAVLLLGSLRVASAANPGEDPPTNRAFGLEARTPWTTSRLAGTPEPARPYTVEPAFPKLAFEQPVVLASAAGSDRLFVAELRGRIFSFPNDPACARADLAIDLTTIHPDLSMFFGLAFHPQFATNRYVYACYMTKDAQPDGARVSRFEVSRTDPPRIDPASEKVLLTWLSGGHDGGCLAFGPDGYLYISTGDAAAPSPPDPLDTGQDLSDLLSSVLRIDVDHEEPGKPYRVPTDNPFVRLKDARPEIWAYGFRNPWRFSFDRATGDLWLGDVGWELWEMIDRVERGGNYGWSIVEGRQPIHPEGRRGPTPILPPVVAHPHSEAASITGGYVYRGSRLKDLDGVYIYGDFQTGKVWGLRFDGKRVTWHQELADTPLQLVSFGADNHGEIYALDYERSKQIYRLVPNPAASRPRTDFPRTLSQTGLFASTREHIPAPGVIGYSINSELWSDHARAERFLAVPGQARIALDPAGNWRLPEGSVLARTVGIDLTTGDPRSRRRLQTQVLHLEDGSWRPYSYVWDANQADATLADAGGSSRTFTIRDPRAPEGQRVLADRVHSRAECLLCHNPWVENQSITFGRPSASPLGLSTAQLNRDHDYGGRVDNQLRALEHIGLFAKPLSADGRERPMLANPYDASADLDRRARSYLQTNCAHCHQFNAGGAATIVLSNAVALAETKTVDQRPMQGTFGIADARIIAPGDPDGSILYYRVAKLGGGRMPKLGSQVVDEKAAALIHDWIARMPRSRAGSTLEAEDRTALETLQAGSSLPASTRTRAIRRLTDSTRGALALMRAMDGSNLADATRREVVAQTKDHPHPEIRDLFERFVPDSKRVRRLGDDIKPESILSLSGDVERGRQVFFAESSQCKNCHRAGGVGQAVGPDMDKVGTKYLKPALLDQILNPSRQVEPNYQTYVLATKSGQLHTGMLVEKNAREVVLKDAANKTIRISAADVEQLAAQAKSLMPDSLLRELTAQQAADLLEFLASLR